jgi:putative hydrolase of the HAD superfamily
MHLKNIDFSAIRGIVFDLDDTLYPQINFKISGFKAVSKWLEIKTGQKSIKTLTYLLDLLNQYGPSYPHFFDDLATSLNLNPIWVSRMITVFRSHPPLIKPFPEVPGLLTKLKKNYKIGILTDGLWTVQQRKIISLGLQKAVDAILYSDRLNTQKPDKNLYRWFEARFDLCGDQLLYVGDNPMKDFIGARKRNWHTIRVQTGEYASLISPINYDADVSIERVTQIEILIYRNNYLNYHL